MLQSTSILFLLAGLAVAAPPPPAETCDPRIICVDAINTCGIKYGACYDICDAAAKPKPPPCPLTTTSTVVPITTSPPTPTSTISTSTKIRSACPSGVSGSGATVCWDGVNACGRMYGGCFPDCKPWPTFVPPPCPSSTSTTTLAKITTRVIG